jgi:hypothetical protein
VEFGSAFPADGETLELVEQGEGLVIGRRSPLALEKDVLAVREEFEPKTDRIAVEVTFASGRVRCDSWGGDLRLST